MALFTTALGLYGLAVYGGVLWQVVSTARHQFRVVESREVSSRDSLYMK
jgi:hypothetical protein